MELPRRLAMQMGRPSLERKDQRSSDRDARDLPRRARVGELMLGRGKAIPVYSTPGIYRATAPPAPDIRLVRTDIAGFAGFAERGPLEAAVRLSSWNEFRRIFGGFIREGYLAYAVRGFFG